MSRSFEAGLDAPSPENIVEFRDRCYDFAACGTSPTPDAQQVGVVTPGGKRLKIFRDSGWDTFSTWDVCVSMGSLTHIDASVLHRATTAIILIKMALWRNQLSTKFLQ